MKQISPIKKSLKCKAAFLFSLIFSLSAPCIKAEGMNKPVVIEGIYYNLDRFPNNITEYEAYLSGSKEYFATVRGFHNTATPSDLTHVDIPKEISATYQISYRNPSTKKYEKKDITIIAKVKKINAEAFKSRESIQSLKIADGIQYIGMSAFYGCTSITEVAIPASADFVGAYVLYGCESLQSATWNAPEIPHGAFENCVSLTNVVLGPEVKSISEEAFSGCTSLSEILIPESVTAIGNNAFDQTTKIERITTLE